jgi:hypothetical protein
LLAHYVVAIRHTRMAFNDDCGCLAFRDCTG